MASRGVRIEALSGDELLEEIKRRIQSAVANLSEEDASAGAGERSTGRGSCLEGLQSLLTEGRVTEGRQAANNVRLRALEDLKDLQELIHASVAAGKRRKTTTLRKGSLTSDEFKERTEQAPLATRDWLRQQFSDAGNDDGEEMDMCASASLVARAPKRVSVLLDSDMASGIKNQLSHAGEFAFDTLSFFDAAEQEIQGSCLTALFNEICRKQTLASRLARKNRIQDESSFGETLLRFIGRVENLYRPDAIYHSSKHAADVTSTVYWFLTSPTMKKYINEVDMISSLVAAAIHDVGHPGVNNLFLQNTMDPIAITYNDRSCLENMHLAIAFELTQTDRDCNWLGQLETEADKIKTRQYVRKGIIGQVLATDMAKHAEYMSEMKEISDKIDNGEINGDGDDAKSIEPQFLLQCILHAADTSNPAKPRDSMLQWTKLINLEFWAQGDRERELGLEISPLCDREPGKKSLPQGQIGFITFVVMPLFGHLTKMLPDCDEAVKGLQTAKAFWEEKKTEEKTFDDIYPTG